MPTILRLNGWRVHFYSNDHRPAHVHVVDSNRECVFELNCVNGPVVLRSNYGCSKIEVNWIEGELNGRLAELCESWRAFHGNY